MIKLKGIQGRIDANENLIKNIEEKQRNNKRVKLDKEVKMVREKVVEMQGR